MSKKRICKATKVARSSIYWKALNRNGRKHYSKSDDKDVLNEIEGILAERSTYGYKRVTAMINKARKKKGQSTLNKKKVYRVMDMNGLLLKKESIKRKDQYNQKKYLVTVLILLLVLKNILI